MLVRHITQRKASPDVPIEGVPRGSRVRQVSTAELEPASPPQGLTLHHGHYLKRESGCFEMGDKYVGQVSAGHYNVLDTLRGQPSKLVINYRLAGDLDHRLRAVVCVRAEP